MNEKFDNMEGKYNKKVKVLKIIPDRKTGNDLLNQIWYTVKSITNKFDHTKEIISVFEDNVKKIIHSDASKERKNWPSTLGSDQENIPQK